MTNGRIDKNHNLTHAEQVKLAGDLKDKGYSNSTIAHILRLPESIVRNWLKPEGES